MIKISNDSAAKDPESVIRTIKSIGVNFCYNEDNYYVFPDLSWSNINNKKIEIEEIKTSYPDYSIHNNLMLEDISCIFLDHREMGYNLSDLLEELNIILNAFDLKIVEIDTQSDYMQAFITKNSESEVKDMIRAAYDLQNVNINEEELFVKESNPDISKNEMEGLESLHYVLRNAKIKNNTINYELLKEFLEDIAPEFEYKLKERGEKIFISINEF